MKKEIPPQAIQGRLFDLPDVEMFQYLLLIKPIYEIDQRIWSLKRDFSIQFKFPSMLFSKPHISILGLISNEKGEERSIKMIRDLTLQFPRFTIDINGFGGFPSHTIFAKVSDEHGILGNYIKAVRFVFGIKMKNIVPHLTIAKGLPKEIYSSAYPIYSSREFQASFQCNSAILLKRKYETGKFVVIEEFNFSKCQLDRH